MISRPSKYEGNEFKGIVLKDIYGVKGWKEGTLDFIFDFGANIGFFSVFMRMRHPAAKVIAIEPCRAVCKYLEQNVTMLGVYIDERPLGDGSLMYMKDRGHVLDALFVSPYQERSYQVTSATLEDFFNSYGCLMTNNYLLKFNCEGGEKYIMGDSTAEAILANAKQACFQFHVKSDFTPFDEWLNKEDYENWVKERFGKTHHIKFYHYRLRMGTFNCNIVPK
jgi:FkbM family methyltransferase